MNGPSYVVSQGMNFWRERFVVVDAGTGELVRLATSADIERPTRESDDSWSEGGRRLCACTRAARDTGVPAEPIRGFELFFLRVRAIWRAL